MNATADRLVAGDVDGLAAALIELPEHDRINQSDDLRRQLRDPDLVRRLGRDKTMAMTTLVTVATATATTPRAHGDLWTVPPRFLELFALRPPDVREMLATWIRQTGSVDWLDSFQALLDHGLVADPSPEEALEFYVRTLGPPRRRRGQAHDPSQQIELLARHPRLAKMMSVLLSDESTLGEIARTDRDQASYWRLLLIGAADRRSLERAELLDIVLDLQAVRRTRQVDTFARNLFIELVPTPDELAARATALVRVLGHGSAASQRVVANHLRQLAERGDLDDHHLVGQTLRTALVRTPQATADAAARLLQSLALPAFESSEAAVIALGHPSARVQHRGLRILAERRADLTDGQWSALTDQAVPSIDSFAPSNRELSTALGLRDDRRRPDAHDAIVVPARSVQAQTVHPVRSGEELVLLLARWLVRGGSLEPIEIERAIDGLARIDPTQIDARTISALDPLLAPWRRSTFVRPPLPRSRFDPLTRHWRLTVNAWRYGVRPDDVDCFRPATDDELAASPLRPHRRIVGNPMVNNNPIPLPGDAPIRGRKPNPPIDWRYFIRGRIWEAALTGVDGARPSLALPSVRAGWIDLDEATDRVEQLLASGHRPHRLELVQMLLRLRDGALPTSGALAGLLRLEPHWETMLAAGRGMKIAVRELVHESTASLSGRTWTWESRIDRVVADEPRPDVRFDDPTTSLSAALSPARADYDHRYLRGPYRSAGFELGDADVDWLRCGLPRHQSLVAAWVASQRPSRSGHRYLATTLDPAADFSGSHHLLLGVALGAKDAPPRITAIDVFETTAVDGRLDPGLLAAWLQSLVNHGFSPIHRLATSLESIAIGDPVVADRIASVLELFLPTVDGQPNCLGRLLETWERACLQSGRDAGPESTRRHLDQLSSGRSKRAGSARRLLSLTQDDHLRRQVARRLAASDQANEAPSPVAHHRVRRSAAS